MEDFSLSSTPPIPPLPPPPPPPPEPPLTSSLSTTSLTSNCVVPDEELKLTETQKILQQLFQDPLLSDLTKYIGSDKNNRALLNRSISKNNSSMTGESSLITTTSLTLEQVDTLIALEMGTAFEITILRCGLEPLKMIVRQNATISDIKNLIVLQVTRDLKERERRNKKISWKYIWKTYCLTFEGQKLLEDKVRIQEIGIRSGSVLKFSRYVSKNKAERGK